VEEALCDSFAMRAFVGIDLGVEGAADETTVCKFRHLLERNKLGKPASLSHRHQDRQGHLVDAKIIGAPSSTKNEEGKRDPEMHQTAKGKQWYCGMKAHVGVDMPHEIDPHHDREALAYLLHGKETRVWGDQGYIKNIFGFRKTRYCGLAKNLHRLDVTAALTNCAGPKSCSEHRRGIGGIREHDQFFRASLDMAPSQAVDGGVCGYRPDPNYPK